MNGNTTSTSVEANGSSLEGLLNNPSGKKLDIGIIGAGIAGLGAAIALRRDGHKVEIFERSKFKYEVGAAINSCPNATRILTRWGFDFVGAQSVVAERRRIMLADSLEVTYSHEDGDSNIKDFGFDWLLLHRVDLHTELRRLAEVEGGGEFVKVRLDAEVSDTTDIENGIIRLKNGEECKKDLIVAADGVHTLFGSKVIGSPNPASPSGHSAFRFLIPTATVVSDPITRPLFSYGTGTLTVFAHPDRRLVYYPCRDNNIQNFAFIHPDNNSSGKVEDWQTVGSHSPEDLLALFPDAHPSVRKILEKAGDIKLWPLLFRKPLKTWHKGKCVLIGDAAHPMLPHHGQGGAQALEDAVALAVMLSNLQNLDEIPRRLELFERVRVNRASAVQIFSSVGQDEAATKLKPEDVQPYVTGPVPKTIKEFREWNFGHDVLKESLVVLNEYLEGLVSS